MCFCLHEKLTLTPDKNELHMGDCGVVGEFFLAAGVFGVTAVGQMGFFVPMGHFSDFWGVGTVGSPQYTSMTVCEHVSYTYFMS